MSAEYTQGCPGGPTHLDPEMNELMRHSTNTEMVDLKTRAPAIVCLKMFKISKEFHRAPRGPDRQQAAHIH